MVSYFPDIPPLNQIIYNKQQHMSIEVDFGQTAQPHADLMGIIWGPVINVGIFMAMYNYRKWWGFLHGIIGLFACIFSLATALPILITTGIISKTSTANYDDFTAETLNNHYLVGIACLSIIVLQTILGITTKLMYYCNASSMSIIRLKKLHAIFGYMVIILCKADYVIIGESNLLIQDGVFVAILLLRKFLFPRMEGRELVGKETPKLVKSIKELDVLKDYFVFGNYVYDAEELRYYHPGGYQIIAAVRNREVDRFIYGMYAPEELPNIPIYSHSYKCMTLVGDPIAKIDIPSVWKGFDEEEQSVFLYKMKIINEKERIHEMYLSKLGGNFGFNKYTQLSQIGRYHSLTLNNKVTRLYTCVNFLVGENKRFMKKYLQGYTDNYGKQCGVVQEMKSNEQTEMVQMKSMSESQLIPILFKQYDNGKFSDGILKNTINSLRISCVKGEGVQFESLNGGKILMLVGGTGIYPLSDLIDMLYKSALAKQKPQLAQQIYTITPLLKNQPFASFNFELIAAFNSLDDVHPITFHQLQFLTSNSELKLTIKLRDQSSIRIKQLRNVIFTKDGFENILQQRGDLRDITKIWICGPPKMNENVSKYLRGSQKLANKYLIL